MTCSARGTSSSWQHPRGAFPQPVEPGRGVHPREHRPWGGPTWLDSPPDERAHGGPGRAGGAHRGREGLPRHRRANARARPSWRARRPIPACGTTRRAARTSPRAWHGITAEVERYDALRTRVEDAQAIDELLADGEDADLAAELAAAVGSIAADVERLELAALLSGPYDDHDAIATLQAGAGGTESMDWADMLLRMYTRWAERDGLRARGRRRPLRRGGGDQVGDVHVARDERLRAPVGRARASTGWSGIEPVRRAEAAADLVRRARRDPRARPARRPRRSRWTKATSGSTSTGRAGPAARA